VVHLKENILTSEIWFVRGRAPENKILLAQMSRVEEVGAEEGAVLGEVANGHVEVPALLDSGLQPSKH
jgi:hypothetical protein